MVLMLELFIYVLMDCDRVNALW